VFTGAAPEEIGVGSSVGVQEFFEPLKTQLLYLAEYFE
jgi:hypothetical protein